MDIRNDSTAPTNISCAPSYYEEYRLNEFFEIIVQLSQVSCGNDKAGHLKLVLEKLSIVQNAVQFLINYSVSQTSVNLNNLDSLVLNLIGTKFHVFNDQCIRNLHYKWEHIVLKDDIKCKQVNALQQSSLNIEILLNRLILQFTNADILTSVEEELQRLKICLFEDGCADMRSFIDAIETNIADMWACMEKHQFGKLCPIKLQLLHQSVEKHFDLCIKMYDFSECSEKDIHAFIEEMSKPTFFAAICTIYKDIESLDTVLRNLNLALSIDFDKEKTLGKCVMERALQLIGEHVKSTMESPKISQPMGKSLEKANVPLKEMKFIRNTLSHNKILTFCVRKELEEPSRSEYKDLQQDFKKIRSIFTKALSRKEFNLLLEYVRNLEENYGEKVAHKDLVEHWFAIKDSLCFKDISKALEKFSLKAQTLGNMDVIITCISEVLNFLKFREVRRNIFEFFINAESTFSFCNQLSQDFASGTESEAIFTPRMIPMLSSKYSKYMKSMFTSMPTAISFKTFSEKFNEHLPCVPKSKMEFYDSFIIYARDDILPEAHDKVDLNNANNVFDVDLRKPLMSQELYNVDEIGTLETKWKLLHTIDSWKQSHDAKCELLLKLKSSDIDKTTFEHLITRLDIEEERIRELMEVFDKDRTKILQIIQDLPNYFEEFLDQLMNMKDRLTLTALDKENLAVLQGMIASFLQSQYRNGQVEALANEMFRRTLSTHQEEMPEMDFHKLKEKFDYSLHVHRVISNLRIHISASGFAVTKDAYSEYRHLFVKLQAKDIICFKNLLEGRKNAKRMKTALSRLTDNYGKFIKAFRENDQLNKNVKAFSAYARTLDIAEKQMDLLISAYQRIEFLQFEAFFYNRIDELRNILNAEDNSIPDAAFVEKQYKRYKFNETMKAAVEMMLLDLLNILKYLSTSLKNYHQLEKIIAISGNTLLKTDQVSKVKNMRNALAHGGLTWHHLTQVFATALTFIQNGKVLLALQLMLEAEGGHNCLVSALDSNSWTHASLKSSFLEIGDLCNTIEQSNLWKDKIWRVQLKQILCEEVQNTTKPLEKCVLWQKFQEELFDAARRNDLAKLNYCIMRDANVNIRTMKRWTPLHYAAISDSPEAISHLLKHHADVNCKDVRSWTPLHLAVMKSSLTSVEILMEHLADDRCRTNSGLTPLQIAEIMNARAIMKLLLHDDLTITDKTPSIAAQQVDERKTLPEPGDDLPEILREALPQEPLISDSEDNFIVRDVHAGSRTGDQKLFAAQDALTTLKPSRMYTLQEIPSSNRNIPSFRVGNTNVTNATSNMETLMKAISSGVLPVVKMLLDDGTIDINARETDGKSLILKAASVGAVDVMKLLLELGAEVNSEDKDGTTPLIEASMMGHFSCVEELLKNKADIERKDNYGHKALNFAISGEFEDIVKILIESKASVNFPNRSYGAPLHDAVFSRNSKIVQYLLENGAHVNAERPNGETPLMAAFTNHDWSTFKILLLHGGDVNAVDERKQTILYSAVRSELVEVVDLILENGAEVNDTNLDGRTPLMEAALLGRSDLVKRLLMADALIDVKDGKGNTAISEAERNGHHDIVRMLMGKQETDAHQDANMKCVSGADGMSNFNHSAGLGPDFLESSQDGDRRNLIANEPTEQTEQLNILMARIGLRELVWIAVREICFQLFSMVI